LENPPGYVGQIKADSGLAQTLHRLKPGESFPMQCDSIEAANHWIASVA